MDKPLLLLTLGAAGIAANLLYLVPSVQGVHKEGLKNSINLYKTNLPNPDLLQTELTLFKSTKSNLKEEKKCPSQLVDMVKFFMIAGPSSPTY